MSASDVKFGDLEQTILRSIATDDGVSDDLNDVLAQAQARSSPVPYNEAHVEVFDLSDPEARRKLAAVLSVVGNTAGAALIHVEYNLQQHEALVIYSQPRDFTPEQFKQELDKNARICQDEKGPAEAQ